MRSCEITLARLSDSGPCRCRRCRPGLCCPGRSGLTIMELVVVVAICSSLLAIVVPAIQSARESARRITCVNNLRQIGLALHLAHDQTLRLPAGWRVVPENHSAWSWSVGILPFLDQSALYAAVHPDVPVESDSNRPAREARLAVMLCPSDLSPAEFALFAETEMRSAAWRDSSAEHPLTMLPASNYVGIFGDLDPDAVDGRNGDGTFVQDRPVAWRDLSQGLGHVMIVSERTTRKLPATWLGVHVDGEDAPARMTGFAWLGPNRPDTDECELDSRHQGLINGVFADGHVSAISDNVDQAIYRAMARRDLTSF
jgi:prepilin-type processing-associated H-X9-DG protein